MSFYLSVFVFLFFSSLQTQHALQDPGAGEAAHGAQRLHDQPRPNRQPARPAAQPRAHGVAQPEATHAQVDKRRGKKKRETWIQSVAQTEKLRNVEDLLFFGGVGGVYVAYFLLWGLHRYSQYT